MKFIIARHAETEANANRIFSGWTDYPLTDKGITQAEKLGYMIKKNYTIDKVYSSPLDRALKTAEIACRSIEREIIVTDSLKEVNFGIFEGMTGDEIQDEHEDHWNSWHKDYVNFRLPQGENLIDLLDRIKPLIDNLKQGNEDCLLVTHAAAMQVAITYLLDLDLKKMWNFQCKNCSFVEIEYSDNFAFIKRLSPVD